jgi:hypothetical protein
MKLSADAVLATAVYTAEPGSSSHGALNLLASWVATQEQAEAASAADGLDRQRESPLADPGYGTGFTGHGTMVMSNSGSPGPAIVHLKGRWSWSQ